MDYITQTVNFVKKELEGAEAGHDWFHIQRVYKNALTLLKTEQANEQVVVLGALLHDIADSKFHNGDETIGPKKARNFMASINIKEDVQAHVVKIIENISFKGGNFNRTFHSKELEIVQDADRLDAIGAIGIARTFNYGGYKNNAMHNPEIAPKLKMTKEEYKHHKGTTINHFYEKLLLLKDLMNTQTGKEMAANRHRYMEGFLEQFFNEWEGKV
ncbi:HD domain-containing protein [Flavobacterium sp. CBA20B-1]|uniref:HD domain-containing protein n=1 Tax=unclassified Flavobacterium TaxID=196869 RepID=UPI0022240491|nr:MULTISPECIES: HD domain-containing protein [unclassified Flavobacterium]WCM41518.1 HD domain-containing protein [Flavobacterium sp. CBA20B-1]